MKRLVGEEKRAPRFEGEFLTGSHVIGIRAATSTDLLSDNTITDKTRKLAIG